MGWVIQKLAAAPAGSPSRPCRWLGPLRLLHVEAARGDIVLCLCSNLADAPAGTPACPGTRSCEVSGLLTPEDIMAGAKAQGIDLGEAGELGRALLARALYVNVHTDKFPAGETGHSCGPRSGSRQRKRVLRAWVSLHATPGARPEAAKPPLRHQVAAVPKSSRVVQHMSGDAPTGWVKPGARPLPETLDARIAELHAEWAEARNQPRGMDQGIRLETLVKVRNLTRAFEPKRADRGLEARPRRRQAAQGAKLRSRPRALNRLASRAPPPTGPGTGTVQPTTVTAT